MSLFRRFRREKAVEPEGPIAPEPSPPSEEPSPETPLPTPPPSSPAPPEAPAIPPPLPDRPTAPSSPPPPAAPEGLSKCFICGSPLSGHTCPNCRMTWVE